MIADGQGGFRKLGERTEAWRAHGSLARRCGAGLDEALRADVEGDQMRGGACRALAPDIFVHTGLSHRLRRSEDSHRGRFRDGYGVCILLS